MVPRNTVYTLWHCEMLEWGDVALNECPRCLLRPFSDTSTPQTMCGCIVFKKGQPPSQLGQDICTVDCGIA